MKALYKIIVSIFLCSAMCICGCLSNDSNPPDNPYIKVIGIQREYEVGDSLNVSGAKVQYYASQNATTYTEVDLEVDMVSEFTTSAVGVYSMTITYNSVTQKITYVVNESINPPDDNNNTPTPANPYITIIGLATEYTVGDNINISNAKIRYYASQNADTYTEVNLQSNMISGFSTASVGTFTMAITYNNVSKNITYIVKESTTPPDDNDTPTPANPYITIIGLATEYTVEENINISNAKIHYYASQNADTYTEVSLQSSMISGFSTASVGTFTMTITYNNVSKNITYIVKASTTPPDNGDGEEATTIINSALDNMENYAEIKETTTISMFGMTASTYIITTQDQQYSYEDDETMHWIVKEDNSWIYYGVEYDMFDEVVEYKRCEVVTESTNMIEFQYSSFVHNDPIAPYTFVKMIKNGNQTTITYYTEMMDMYCDIVISNNKIISQTAYAMESNSKITISTTTYTYYTTPTGTIPTIPNNNWTDGGFYIKG